MVKLLNQKADQYCVQAYKGWLQSRFPEKSSTKYKETNQTKQSKSKETMDAKWEEIDLKFGPNGTTLDGLKLLRSIINEWILIRNLTKKFEITMKATDSYTPYVKICDEKTKTKEFLCRYKSIDFEKELRHYSWKPKSQAHKKRKKEVAESSTIQKKQQQYPLL